jgi:multiple sugar transport system ATP-binding protein
VTAPVTLTGVAKVYPDGTRAVTGLDLRIDAGELMVIVGPSGCGKTTTLRMTAGLEEISEGEIRIGDRLVNTLDPRERDVAMVFQNYALYPHMSVFDNLAFPLRARGLPKAEIRAQVERTARLLELDDLLKRKPRALSGGQRQRVAMGRAIVREPQVFLMDEPLSNLDARLRMQMRTEIAGLQRELGVTTMYVTHDQLEAMTMGTQIAILRDGLMQQCGPPQELYDEPGNLFVATFIGSPGMNLLHGRIERDGDALHCAVGERHLSLDSANRSVAALASYVDREVVVGIRPEHLTETGLAGSKGHELRGRVVSVELLGAEQLARVELPMTRVPGDDEQVTRSGKALATARLDAHARIAPGDLIDLAIDTRWLHFFDPATGHAIR